MWIMGTTTRSLGKVGRPHPVDPRDQRRRQDSDARRYRGEAARESILLGGAPRAGCVRERQTAKSRRAFVSFCGTGGPGPPVTPNRRGRDV